MAGKTKPGIPVKGINIKLKMINDLMDVTGSAKDSWNPAEISDDMKAIAYIHDLADTWNPAQLNEALKYLGFATIDSWNPAIIEETKNKLVRYFLPTDASGNPIELNLKGSLPYEVTALTVDLLPIQDLHGYDNPWVGGAGKNKCPIRESGAPGNIYNVGYLLPVSNGDTVYCYFEYTYSDSANLFGALFSNASETIKNNGTSLGTFQSGTVRRFDITSSGYFGVCYSSGVATYTITKAMISKSNITQYEPYENICPISGRNSVELVGTGKNLYNPDNTFNGYTNNGVITASNNFRTVYCKCVPNTTYTVSKMAGKRFRVGTIDNPIEAGVEYYDLITDDTATSITITTNNHAKYLIAFVYNANADTVTEEQMLGSVQIEVGSQATTYEPYQGETTEITLPQTVYGGNVNVLEGGTSSTYGYIASYDGEELPGEWISDRDAYAAGTAPTTGAEVVYILATPETLTTSAEEVTLINGENTLSTDGDKINITYKANLNS